MLFVVFVWVGTALAGECAPVPIETLRAEIATARAGLSIRTLPAFQAQAAAVFDHLRCVDRALTADDVVAVHEIEWLVAWFQQRTGDSARAFQAARRLDPSWQPRVALAAEGSEIYDRAVAAPPLPRDRTPIPTRARGTLRVDGRAAVDRPVEVPTVVQFVGDAGEVQATAYLRVDDPFPAEPAPQPVAAIPSPPTPVAEARPEPTAAIPVTTAPAAEPPVEPAPTVVPEPEVPAVASQGTESAYYTPTPRRTERPARVPRPGRPSLWLGLGGLGAGVLAAGSMGAAALIEAGMAEECSFLPPAEARSYGCLGTARAANGMAVSSYVLDVVGIGLGTTALVVWNW